jgi:hypothetical protein
MKVPMTSWKTLCIGPLHLDEPRCQIKVEIRGASVPKRPAESILTKLPRNTIKPNT